MGTTNDRLLIGTRKGLIEAHRQGGTWTLKPPALAGQPIPYAMRDARNGAIWASIDHGHWGVKLARSKSDDGSYDEVEAPKYPEATEAAAKYYWVLEGGHADAKEQFWIGTEPGGLFTTDDDGATWELNEPLWKMCAEHEWMGGGRDAAGVHSICVDPRDGDHVYVAISCAGVIETKDGGKSWAYANKGQRMDYAPEDQQDQEYGFDPHCMVMSPANPDVLWQANHCGVYRSTNGSESWDELSQKPFVYFGFPIATHPTMPDTAWIVPMKSAEERTTVDGRMIVMRTDDGGATWNEQTAGLPQQAWDFPYRHALDIAPDGDTLAFGTTSGNLYVTNDGGASWEAITNSLPMIYSVRFA